MANQLLKNTRQTLVSVPYSELSAGFGLQTYYLLTYEDSSGSNYTITESLDYSSDIVISEADSTHSYTFDSGEFAMPRLLSGEARFNFSFWHNCAGSTKYVITIGVYHYDGSTATQIDSDWTSKDFDTNNTGVNTINALLSLSKTRFIPGDQLRVIVTFTQSGGTSGGYEFGIDPQNRDGTNITPSSDADAFTQFIVNVPFKVRSLG